MPLIYVPKSKGGKDIHILKNLIKPAKGEFHRAEVGSLLASISEYYITDR